VNNFQGKTEFRSSGTRFLAQHVTMTFFL